MTSLLGLAEEKEKVSKRCCTNSHLASSAYVRTQRQVYGVEFSTKVIKSFTQLAACFAMSLRSFLMAILQRFTRYTIGAQPGRSVTRMPS